MNESVETKWRVKGFKPPFVVTLERQDTGTICEITLKPIQRREGWDLFKPHQSLGTPTDTKILHTEDSETWAFEINPLAVTFSKFDETQTSPEDFAKKLVDYWMTNSTKITNVP